MPANNHPIWTEPLLQGLAFWIGYQRSRYFGYHLTEGAIAAEAAALRAGRIGHRPGDMGFGVRREVLLRELGGSAPGFGSGRVDLLVQTPPPDGTEPREVSVVEVKRADASASAIHKDLNRLACLMEHSVITGLRAFLVMVGEQRIPDEFVKVENLNGAWSVRAKSGIHNIGRASRHSYAVRRTCIAASSLRKSGNTHSATLIEVLSRPE